MRISEITSYLDQRIPRAMQESYDNSGLLVGDAHAELTSALISLDITEEVVREAIDTGANLIIAHHPIIFSGLKKLTGSNYVERTVQMAIKHDVALYACHTNLDNMDFGVNRRIADRLGLKNVRILRPLRGKLLKLVSFVPDANKEKVLEALFQAGAGHIGAYSECSFQQEGLGTFKAGEGSDPFVGEIGHRHTESEVRIEVVLPEYRERAVIQALLRSHPYEEVAYDLYELRNAWPERGAGMIGELEEAMPPMIFLRWLKEKMNAAMVRYTDLEKDIKRVAFCGGSGSFLLPDAIAQKADVFITGDFKYHQFFDAEGRIMIADIGHYESEQFTTELLADIILEKFPNFAVRFTSCNTNPIKYL